MAFNIRNISSEHRQQVNQTVQRAEARTSAELVPAIAAWSGRYDRAEDVVGVLLAAVAAVIAVCYVPGPDTTPGSWGDTPAWVLPVAVGLIVPVVFLTGAALASRSHGLRRLFTPASQLRDEVQAAAQRVFFDRRVHHTRTGGGVLFYVSCLEHLAVVLADEAVLQAVGQETIDAWCQQLTAALSRTQDPIAALRDAMEAAAQDLAPRLPREQSDVNELPDALVVIDAGL